MGGLDGGGDVVGQLTDFRLGVLDDKNLGDLVLHLPEFLARVGGAVVHEFAFDLLLAGRGGCGDVFVANHQPLETGQIGHLVPKPEGVVPGGQSGHGRAELLELFHHLPGGGVERQGRSNVEADHAEVQLVVHGAVKMPQLRPGWRDARQVGVVVLRHHQHDVHGPAKGLLAVVVLTDEVAVDAPVGHLAGDRIEGAFGREHPEGVDDVLLADGDAGADGLLVQQRQRFARAVGVGPLEPVQQLDRVGVHEIRPRHSGEVGGPLGERVRGHAVQDVQRPAEFLEFARGELLSIECAHRGVAVGAEQVHDGFQRRGREQKRHHQRHHDDDHNLLISAEKAKSHRRSYVFL
jgi:hypothetical protein